ncbi:hydroxylysine kinase-like [Paramacrobiotus metropolitanus]|uniref:hydroxylysine kinase-like n=1 Tax=Paramacrobiotus metropolitanus TaxID=2943436 RepID=UPI002445EAC6|nr:hydroxylysine kinase-like [Paramacrobiotus metropolitanus]
MVKPCVTFDDIRNLVQEIYGLTVTSAKQLDGYDDANFFIQVGQGSDNANIPAPAPDGYVLKISHGKFTSHSEQLKVQNELMHCLSGQLGPVQVPIPQATKESKTLGYVDLPMRDAGTTGGTPVTSKHIIRLYSFIPGSMMSSVKCEPSAETLMDIGVLAARLVQTFSGCDGDARFAGVLSTASSMLWSLEGICAGYLEPLLQAVDNPLKLEIFRDIIGKFRRQMSESSPFLERGIIHGDINEGNVLLNRAADGEDWMLNGLIDFGDLHQSCRIFELILAMMYMMLECFDKGTLDPIEAGGYVLAGYLSMHVISPAEIRMLKIGIEARCVQSLVIGLYTYKFEQPGNMYVLTTQTKGWAVLEKLYGMSERHLFGLWDKILLKALGREFFHTSSGTNLTISNLAN